MVMDFMGPMIPITAIFLGIACAVFAMYFRSKRQKDEQETIRLAMEKGVDLPEELFKKVEESACSHSNPLRKGIFWTMTGLSLFIALYVNQGLEEAIWGIIPFAIGIGFLLFNKLDKESPGQDRDS